MKTVSESYKESMSQLLRNRSYAHVTLENIDKAIAADGEWESNGAMAYSDMASMDGNASRNMPPATLEWNYWALDGSFGILDPDTTTNEGFVSDEISDDTGLCETPPLLTREFDTPHTVEIYTLSFDCRVGEWPLEARLILYLNDVPVDAVYLAGLTDARTVINRPPVTCDKITLEVLTQLPYRRSRMESFVFGVILDFDNDTIMSAETSNDVDPLSRRLPQENLEVSVIDLDHRYDPENPQGLYGYIAEKSSVSIAFGYEIEDGVIEWLKPDKYLLDSRPTIENERIIFKAGGLLSTLTDTYYKSQIGTKNLYNMAEAVLQDAGITAYQIDESLLDMTTTAVLPIDTHANCLQMIAHAARCVLYTDDDNLIHIEPFVLPESFDEYPMTLDFDTITERSQVLTKTELLKAVAVQVGSYVPNEGASQLYTGTTDETVLHIEFAHPAENVTITVTGGSVLTQTIYGRAIDLTLTSGIKTIVVTGIEQYEGNVIMSTEANPTGAVDTETNPLITNDAMRVALANHVKKYLSYRNTYDLSYRGNPELETKDIVGMETRYSGIVPLLVLTNAINFNGAITGQIKGKALM